MTYKYQEAFDELKKIGVPLSRAFDKYHKPMPRPVLDAFSAICLKQMSIAKSNEHLFYSATVFNITCIYMKCDFEAFNAFLAINQSIAILKRNEFQLSELEMNKLIEFAAEQLGDCYKLADGINDGLMH